MKEKGREIKSLARQEQIKQMIARGISITDMAKALKVRRDTIYKDIESLKKSIKKILKEQPLEEFLLQFITNYDSVGRELWKMYRTANMETVKLGALNSIINLMKEKGKTLTELGILEASAQKIDQKIVVSWLPPEKKTVKK